MTNQFRTQHRNQRWRMNRQLNNRRRVNIYLLEKRVSYLEGRQEVVSLDLDNTHDLMTALEQKVQGLVEREKARQQAEKTDRPRGGRANTAKQPCAVLALAKCAALQQG